MSAVLRDLWIDPYWLTELCNLLELLDLVLRDAWLIRHHLFAF